MKVKISRHTFVILLILFIFVLAFFALKSFVGFIFNRDTREVTYPSSNVEYTKWQLPDGAKTRLGKGTINEIKFSPDGTQFAVATTIGVWIYDAKTGNEISLLKGDREDILHIAYLSDGNTLRGVNRNYSYIKVMQWNTTTGKQLSSIQDIDNKHIYISDFSENGMRLAGIDLSKHNEVDLWTIADTTIPMTISSIRMGSESKIEPEPVIALSSDGGYLATIISEEGNNPIQVWNVDTGELLNTFTGNTHRTEGLTFSPDNMTLVSGDTNETIRLWNLKANSARIISKGTYTSSYTLAFSPNGKLIAAGNDDGNIQLFNINEEKQGYQNKQMLSCNGHKDKVTSLAFSPDGKMLISGSEDGTIRGWDVASRKLLFISAGHPVEITDLAEIKDENNLLSIHWLEDQILRWDLNSGHQLTGIYLFNKSPEALSPDGMTLVIEEWFLFMSDEFKIWNIPKRQKQSILKGHNYDFSSYPKFVFSLDGKLLASTDTDYRNRKGDILIWHIENAKRSFFQTIFFRPKTLNLTHTLSGHTDRVDTMVFSSNGEMLASSGYDKKLCLWNVQTGENIFTQTGPNVSGDALVFSSDNKILASGNYETIVLWDTTTGLQINKTKTQDVVNILQFSPDNRILLSGTYTSGKIQLFDTQFLQLLSTHQGHSDDVNQLLFLSDEKSLVSASEDGTMLLWDWEKISQGINNK